MRAVAEGEVQPLGTDTVHRVSVRFLSATDRPIVRAPRHREQLFHGIVITHSSAS